MFSTIWKLLFHSSFLGAIIAFFWILQVILFSSPLDDDDDCNEDNNDDDDDDDGGGDDDDGFGRFGVGCDGQSNEKGCC